jgi:hypothetical protein
MWRTIVQANIRAKNTLKAADGNDEGLLPLSARVPSGETENLDAQAAPSISIASPHYDAFSLAADIMEPFRPIIDERVGRWIEDDPYATPD